MDEKQREESPRVNHPRNVDIGDLVEKKIKETMEKNLRENFPKVNRPENSFSQFNGQYLPMYQQQSPQNYHQHQMFNRCHQYGQMWNQQQNGYNSWSQQ